MTAKPVTYLVNLSEADYTRKKNKWCVGDARFVGALPSFCRLPKIKAWIDTNNPGDPLIPFSVSLEERLSTLSDEEKVAAQKDAAQGALGKITQAGYSSLDVCDPSIPPVHHIHTCMLSLSGTLPADLMR